MDTDPDAGGPSRRTTALAVVALLVLPATAAVALARDGGERVAPLPPEVEVVQGDGPTADFLAAFERSRTATYRVRQATERQRAGAVALTSSATIVQRPPDRLAVAADGSVEGVRDGRVVRCVEEECYVGGPDFDYGADVAEQVRNLAGLVQGDEAIYAVGAEAGPGPTTVGLIAATPSECFLLDLLRQVPAPPYGTFARFCFDPTTGAPTLIRVERPGAVDETVAEALTAEVTDDDLTLPGGR
jgi:hypothetical protein